MGDIVKKCLIVLFLQCIGENYLFAEKNLNLSTSSILECSLDIIDYKCIKHFIQGSNEKLNTGFICRFCFMVNGSHLLVYNANGKSNEDEKRPYIYKEKVGDILIYERKYTKTTEPYWVTYASTIKIKSDFSRINIINTTPATNLETLPYRDAAEIMVFTRNLNEEAESPLY